MSLVKKKILKKCVMVVISQLLTNSWTYSHNKLPYVNTKVPYVNTKLPYVNTKLPYVNTKLVDPKL